ncbi:MAG: hypothetical protein JNM41_12070 [Flavipsychrobacter sp.]|nr:hypothetical protein [Flavipsychrobacter sp.]
MKDHTTNIINFINQIGIPCMPATLTNDTFLPGIDIRNGIIWYDTERMKHPGDLLHEAGHVAVLLPEDRKIVSSPYNINGDLQAGGAEMAAIAWSWAALKHLAIPPEIVFHENGYKSGGADMIRNFTNGQYLGHHLLAWMGMTYVSENEPSKNIYPAMTHWLRPETPIS